MNKIALVSAADNDYAELLVEMLSSIQNSEVDFDIKIFDLGLDAKSRRRIVEATHGRPLEILEPHWTRQIENQARSPASKKVYLAKPFIPNFFPGFEAYLWADADLWFQDPDAISHYISAGRRHGSAFSFESHPLYQPSIKVKSSLLLGFCFVRGFKDYLFGKTKEMFGTQTALRIGIRPVLNSGIFYLEARSPIWDAWQNTIRKANLIRHQRSDQICDQTCLQVAIVENGLKHATLPAIYNWLPRYCAPVFDTEEKLLVDPVYPNDKIYVIHLAGAKNSEFTVPASDGTCEKMALRWPVFSTMRERRSRSVSAM